MCYALAPMKTSPRSSILIDLAAIRHNVAHLLDLLSPTCGMLVAVKADGYGHGTLPVARAVAAAGARGVAVATAEEAVALRDAGFTEAILVMGPLYSFDQYEEMARQGVDFAVVSDHMAAVLPELRGTGLRARVHLKIDSGMNRQGLFPSEVERFLDSIRGIPEIDLVGVMTHFACASEDPASVDWQLDRFCRRAADTTGVALGNRPRRQQRSYGRCPSLPPRLSPLRMRCVRTIPLARRSYRRRSEARSHLEVTGGPGEAGGGTGGRRLRARLLPRQPHRCRPRTSRLWRRSLSSFGQPRARCSSTGSAIRWQGASPWTHLR